MTVEDAGGLQPLYPSEPEPWSMMRPGGVPGTRVSGGGGSESEDEVEELLELRSGGIEGEQAMGGGKSIDLRICSPGLSPLHIQASPGGALVSTPPRETAIRTKTLSKKQRGHRENFTLQSVGLEDLDWSGLNAGKEARDCAESVEIWQGSVLTQASLQGLLEILLPRLDANALGMAVSVEVAKAVSRIGPKAVSQRTSGAGGSAVRLVIQKAAREEGPAETQHPGARAGMSNAQILEFVQSGSVVVANFYSPAFNLHVVVKPLKKVVLDVDGFSLAEDEVDPGLELLGPFGTGGRGAITTATSVPLVVLEDLEWFADTLLEGAGFEVIQEQFLDPGGVLHKGSFLVGGLVRALRQRSSVGPAAQMWELATVALGLAMAVGELSGTASSGTRIT
ncbi:hypothetical protein BC829DRAFT_445607 [Chytridium lagenaria]|nr:hypothetical protein BC829DRAFT_445607 [Chytridium lagenaria]